MSTKMKSRPQKSKRTRQAERNEKALAKALASVRPHGKR